VESVADTIVVLYAGVVVERGPARAILRTPGHPYTQALLRCVPQPGRHRVRGKKRARLPVLEGKMPDLRAPPEGCRFQERCPHTFDRCKEESVGLYPEKRPEGDVMVRCFLFDPEEDGRRPSVLGDSLP